MDAAFESFAKSYLDEHEEEIKARVFKYMDEHKDAFKDEILLSYKIETALKLLKNPYLTGVLRFFPKNLKKAHVFSYRENYINFVKFGHKKTL